jgi:hypothetical protein
LTTWRPDALELLAAAPDPASAARLQPSKIMAALKRAGRHRVADKAAGLQRGSAPTIWPSRA